MFDTFLLGSMSKAQ